MSGCQRECFFLKSSPHHTHKMLFQDDAHPCCLSLSSTVIVFLLTDLVPSVCLCKSRCCGSWAKQRIHDELVLHLKILDFIPSSFFDGAGQHTHCDQGLECGPQRSYFKRKTIAVMLTNTEIWTLYLATSSFKE